jgi:predicted  nucleic acid-binding Zn-ribbon protein
MKQRNPLTLSSFELKYNQIIADYENEIKIYNQNIESKKVEAQTSADNAYLQSQLNRQEQLNSINKKIADLNAKYSSDVATARSSSMMTLEQSNAVVRSLNSKYIIDYDTLMAEFQKVKYSN